MIIISSPIGNINDPAWREQLQAAQVDVLVLDQWDAQKNRLRKSTAGGVEVAISLPRGVRLADGDVLTWDEVGRTAIIAEVRLGEVMVIEIGAAVGRSTAELQRIAFELGHAIGNQHWPAVVKDTAVYVPVTVDRKIMDSVMRTHDLAGVTHEFVAGTEIIAFLAPHEARRLFGGADSAGHVHVPVAPE